MLNTVIPTLIFLAIMCVALALQARFQPVRVDVKSRLGQALAAEDTFDVRQVELSKPISERIVRPALVKLSLLAGRILPVGILRSLEPKVIRAGTPGGLAANEYVGLKVFLALGLPAVLYYAGQTPDSPRQTLMLFLATLCGWKLPDFYLAKKAGERAQAIEKSLPDTLDLLTVSVEAGLGFDGAIAKVVEKSKGPVAAEFRRVLQEIKMGKTRREGLRDLAERSGVDDVTTFVNALIQSDQLGLSIGNTLRIQSEQMRRKRRQRIEEQAMKAPVKMLIPLILFIFPTIFIVLLGPALIQVLDGLVW